MLSLFETVLLVVGALYVIVLIWCARNTSSKR